MITNKQEIMALFYFISDFVNEELTQIELTPIKLYDDNTYLCGLKIDENTQIITAHIKKFNPNKKININTIIYETPIEETYTNIDQINEKSFITTFITFKTNFFQNIDTASIAFITYEDNDKQQKQLNVFCESKRLLCRFMINFKKLHKHTKQQFIHFSTTTNKQKTNPNTTNNTIQQQEQTLLQLVTT